MRKYHENLSEILIDSQVLLKVISRLKSLAPGDREVSSREGARRGNATMYKHSFPFSINTYIYTAMLRNAKKEN